MESFSAVTVVAALGVAAGLFLLARGLAGHRSLVRVGDLSSSTIGSLAAGEVRVSGIIEAAEVTLVSLLQSAPCVYYRATVGHEGDRRYVDPGYTEERSIGFRVRDETGSLRVFPRGARFDAPVCFEGETDSTGDDPSGLAVRRGGSTQVGEVDRAMAIAALLEVREPGTDGLAGVRDGRGRRTYREARLAPGDPVTIVGRALPFADLADPEAADVGLPDVGSDDPEVAADLAAARAAGVLADDPAEAWGNAAIPGFGVGRPVTEPDLDPGANALPIAGADEAVRARRTFEIAPETLVIAASPEVPLLIAHGIPNAVVERGQVQFMVGLLGAILAIVSAMVVAIDLSGGFRR
ncbi:MAG TPA: hypothetical protein VF119_04950 [Candidatus Limnocylindrales bacterium]